MVTAALIFGCCLALVLIHGPGLREAVAFSLLGLVFKSRTIYKPDGRLYLRRFFITPRSWLGPGNWPRALSFVPVRFRKIFLHRIRLSDDRTPHDHPWRFTSIILAGKYIEHTTLNVDSVPVVKRKRAGMGRVLRNKATHIHRLEIVRPVWSLVFAGPSYREWGFWTDGESGERGRMEWVDWRTFLGCQDEPTPPEDAFEGDPWFAIHAATPASPQAAELVRRIAGRRFLTGPSYEVPEVCTHSDHVDCKGGL